MDVSADHAVDLLGTGKPHHGLLELGDVLHRGFRTELEVGRHRPVSETQTPSDAVEVGIESQDPVIETGSHPFQETIESDEAVELGELYVDFEDVSKLWGQERLLNLRAGRLDIPFGEEYLSRDAIDNPLVAHSITDFWGIDEGVELYGSAHQVSYVVAVQNGGHPMLKDGTADKSVAVRLGWDPTRWLHGSVSLMRTGSLDVGGDQLSELWIGNGFFRALGPANRTTRFHAELAQGDLRFLLPDGHVAVSGGAVRFDDNDPQQDNRRQLFLASAEVVHRFNRHVYAAGRYSRILAPDGFPVAGLGTFGQYFFRTLSTDVWRATVGVGYRFSDNLVLKTDYSFEGGGEQGGRNRQRTDLFAAQIAIRY